MADDGANKKGRRSFTADDTSREKEPPGGHDSAGENASAFADRPASSVDRRGRRVLSAADLESATPGPSGPEAAPPKSGPPGAAVAGAADPVKPTDSAEPADSAGPGSSAGPKSKAEPRIGGLGRWRDKLQSRSARPAVQPPQTPARDVEISTSEAAVVDSTDPPEKAADPTPTAGPHGAGAASSFARPKATPLKRRSHAAAPSSDGQTETAAVTATEGPARADSDAPTETDPHALVLPARSSDPAGTSPAADVQLSAAAGTAGPQGPDSPPPMWQEPHRLAMDKKTKTSLLIAGIAGALLAVLAIGFAVYSVTTNADVAGPSVGPSITASSAPTPTALADEFMLDDADAQLIDPEAGWKVSLTQESTNAESPQPICVQQNSEGLPTPLATKLRTLTTANTAQTAALHQADGYATADEAQQVFDDRLTQLGTCADSPVYLQSGIDVEGVGDQAGGIVAILQGEKAEYHSVVLTRTGKVVNIIDVAQIAKPVSVAGLGRAAAAVVDDECSAAVGLCSFTPEARVGVPPLGGDQPGFLAGADLPRITEGAGDWSGTNPVTDIAVVGSQCESIDFANVDGPTNRKSRTYLLRNDDSAPANFGIDEVRFTMSTPAEASELVDKISGSVNKCPDRALTAKVRELPKIDGTGADKVAVKGRSFLVTQKTQGGNVLFRIAMVSAGNKFAYLVLPTDPKFDFTDEQWTAVALRSGQRMSQVR